MIEKIVRQFRKLSLAPVTRAVVAQKLTYLELDKLQRMETALAETRGLQGDILEFGVALGGSGIMLAHATGPDRRFVGFDVFGMIPPPTSTKDDAASRARYEVIHSGHARGLGGKEYYGYRDDLYEEVKASFARNGVPVDGKRIILLKGLFEETWPTLEVSRIALAHIDCDWYDPVRYCLEACADRMCPGGIIITDDYHNYSGARIAIDEFVAQRRDFAFEDGANPFLRKM
jgi:asparagine synthase (glutamine-hydrolysing)